MTSLRQLAGTATAGLRLGHPLGRAQVLRDLSAFLRIECLGALSLSGLATALGTPGTPAELAERSGLSDVELTTALLDLAVSHRLVRRQGDRYRIRGSRLRAVASGRAPDVAGVAEEAASYDGPIYAGLPAHLRGAPKGPYDAGLGHVIARVSRLVEPVVGPWLADRVREVEPRRVLDVGCGSAVNLRWLAGAAAAGTHLAGVDVSDQAVADARANLAGWGFSGIEVVEADVEALPPSLTADPWDLVLLAQNIYYWPVGDRSRLLARLRDLTGRQGTVVALTAVPTRTAISRNLDLVLRVTEGCHRLPTRDELEQDGRAAGFTSVDVRDVLPGSGLAALIASG